MPLISVCVCTCRRPASLLRLLASLDAQRAESIDLEVVVADNDPSGSAAAALALARERFPALALRAEVEPMPGVSFARNRTVAMARGELLAFIDDDEEAAPGWLASLLEALELHRADAVLGPVLPVFPPGSPAWVQRSGFFERPRPATGAVLVANGCRMGNALVRRRWFEGAAPFDAALARSGAEDYDFFRRIIGAGARVVWCDSACVSEEVPAERQRLGWMLARALRAATTYWRLQNGRRPAAAALASALLGAAAAAALGLAGVLLLPLGRHRALAAWRRAAGGLGRALALTPVKTHGYGGASDA